MTIAALVAASGDNGADQDAWIRFGQDPDQLGRAGQRPAGRSAGRVGSGRHGDYEDYARAEALIDRAFTGVGDGAGYVDIIRRTNNPEFMDAADRTDQAKRLIIDAGKIYEAQPMRPMRPMRPMGPMGPMRPKPRVVKYPRLAAGDEAVTAARARVIVPA